MKKFLRSLIANDSVILLSWHRLKALIAATRYGFPARKLTVIGVTGTDGKTTTVGMVAHILLENECKVGALSTAYFRIGSTIEWNATQKTSPSPFVVQKFLRRLVREKCTHAVLECSSHGLLQGRLDWTWPLVGAITNLSEEHLDYHGSMESYLQAKSILFHTLQKKNGVKILNASDRSFTTLSSIQTPWTITYAHEKRSGSTKTTDDTACHIIAYDLSEGLRLSAKILYTGNEKESLLELPMAGGFNISNALAAIGCTHGVGVAVESSIAALKTFSGVPGRMERISSTVPFSVFIDFTVTPQSYESTLKTLRATVREKGRVLALAGSCGDRMREKRPVVGSLLATLADIAYITNEDPYTEDPEKIIDEVVSGLPPSTVLFQEVVPESRPSHYCVRVSDRKKAIQMILREAKENDVVLLCGKGSDTTMMTAEGQIPWNEREIVSDELRLLEPKL